MRIRRGLPALMVLWSVVGVGVPGAGPAVAAGSEVKGADRAFSDVPVGHAFYGDVEWLVGEDVTSGYSDGTYGPTLPVTRQAMAAFLFRFANQGVTEAPKCSKAQFADVLADHKFCGEIAWLVAQGVTSGYSDFSFRPTAVVTRQAMAAFLFRFAEKSVLGRPTCGESAFGDVGADHGFCGEIDWLADSGVTGGYSDGSFRPTAPVSRQAMAAFLHRLDGFGPGVNEIAEEVVVVEQADVVFSVFDEHGVSTLEYSGTEVIGVGDLVVTTRTEGPFYARVISVDGSELTATPASLMDVVPRLDLSLGIDAETGLAVVDAPDGGEAIEVISAPLVSPGTEATSSATGSCGTEVAGTVDADVSVDPGSFELNANWSAWRGPELLEVLYTPTFNATLHAGVDAPGTCTFHADLFDVDLATTKFTIGPVPVWITQHLAAELDAEVWVGGQASVDAGVTVEGRVGSRWQDGAFHFVNEFSANKDFDTELEVESDARLDVPVEYRARPYGIVDFDAAAGPFVELGVDASSLPWFSFDAGLQGRVNAEFDLNAGPIDYNKSYTQEPWEFARWRMDDSGSDPGDAWPGPQITTEVLPAGDPGEAYSATISATGGTAPLTWSVTGALPAGLTLDTATATIAGTPTAEGSYPIDVAVSDAGGYSTTRELMLTIGTPPPAFPEGRITAGRFHTCGLHASGTATCWGDNDHGQSTPPTGTFTQLTAGQSHTCGLRNDGTATCWGSNFAGESTPPTGTFTQLTAGGYHTCGLRNDGTAICWGSNDSGESTPPTGTFTQLTAGTDTYDGGGHTCGLSTDGTATCWGDDDFGQSSPPDGTFTQLTAGEYHTCGLRTTGAAICWGANSHGQSKPPTGTFTQLASGSRHTCGLLTTGAAACWGINYLGESTPPAGTFIQVTAGYEHSCGLRTDGTAACWGDSLGGQSTPPAGNFTELTAGYEHTCGLHTSGTATCWGNYFMGQSTPPAGTFSQITAGNYHTCGLRTTGAATCWGDNFYGQSTPPAGTFTQLTAGGGIYGGGHTCGRRTSGGATCWGDNSFGQSTPPAGTFTQLAAGDTHTCGLRTDGTATCWGDDDYGRSSPPTGTFTQLTAGFGHTCGLRTDGTATCWGWNFHGQSTPPIGTFTQLTAGFGHTCGLRTDGTATCWGDNSRGQSERPTGTFTQLTAGPDRTCGTRADGVFQCWGSMAALGEPLGSP